MAEITRMSDGQDRSQSLLKHPGWGLAGTLAGPATLAIAGTLFIAGYSYKEMLLRFCGLSEGVVVSSLQATMSKGYLALLTTAIAVAVVGSALTVFVGLFAFLLRMLLAAAEWFHPITFAKKFFTLRRRRGNNFFRLSFILLTAGSVSGMFTAAIDYADARYRVHNGCKTKCFSYYFKDGTSYNGIIIAQDDKNSVIFTTSGTIVVPSADIKKIVRHEDNMMSLISVGLLF
ncbi:hypothetical protein SAMN05518668_104343 [Sphingobium sp. YR657]|uniref:hypothetical protein n=1 Tax=Sphingobium sp. YR657 TaxID=1884366 RepID=UPI0009245BE0|nr:hypothetical protein [Sphingobium sp. YR657]SHL96328.1 hypothetical protein SAMN05518668_104343 [Sphingobium sp. YR657]